MQFLMDTHVHIYPCYHLDTFFDSAYRHFQQAKKEYALPNSALGCLFLTEAADQDFFHKFQQIAGTDSENRWRFFRTKEEETLLVKEGQKTMVLVAGRQIAVKEKIEILALGCNQTFEDGLSASHTINQVAQSGGVMVLPWGFGKWWGKRGEIISSLIKSEKRNQFLLGDTGNQLQGGFYPSQFKLALKQNIPVVTGSDPLPIKSHEKAVGRCGIIVEGQIDMDRPGEGLKRILLSLKSSPRFFGRGEKLLPFLKNQMLMQFIKRSRSKKT